MAVNIFLVEYNPYSYKSLEVLIKAFIFICDSDQLIKALVQHEGRQAYIIGMLFTKDIKLRS